MTRGRLREHGGVSATHKLDCPMICAMVWRRGNRRRRERPRQHQVVAVDDGVTCGFPFQSSPINAPSSTPRNCAMVVFRQLRAVTPTQPFYASASILTEDGRSTAVLAALEAGAMRQRGDLAVAGPQIPYSALHVGRHSLLRQRLQ